MTRLAIPKTYKLYIGGAFPRSESGRTYEVAAADGSFLANAALASRKDARDAVVAARAAHSGWAGATAYNRGQVLYRIAELLDGRRGAVRRGTDRIRGHHGGRRRSSGGRGGRYLGLVRGLVRQVRAGRWCGQSGVWALLQHLGAGTDGRRRDRGAAGVGEPARVRLRRRPGPGRWATPSS